ncbi:MAG: hypothetical protein ACOCZW_03125, partial [Bacteroidota bacterium]
KAAFILEASPESGMGHIYRSIELADKLLNKKVSSFFLCSGDYSLCEKISSVGYHFQPYSDELKLILQLNIYQPDVVIVDLPLFNNALLKKISDLFPVGTLGEPDDRGKQFIKFMVISAAGNKPENTAFKTNGLEVLSGPKYAILRDEFITKRNQYRFPENSCPKSILLTFGGSDPSGLTVKFLKMIKDSFHGNITVITGRGFLHMQELEKLISDMDIKGFSGIKILKDVKYMAKLMLQHELIVCSPGVTLFEAYCLGMPAIAITQNETQAGDFANFSYIYELQNIKNPEELINLPFEQKDEYRDYIKKMDCGSGKNEITELILGMTT